MACLSDAGISCILIKLLLGERVPLGWRNVDNAQGPALMKVMDQIGFVLAGCATVRAANRAGPSEVILMPDLSKQHGA